MYEDLIFANEEEKGKKIISKVWGKKPLFTCVIANTDTGKIKGISVAGENPEITDYTPPADVELLEYGSCKCIDGVPITPDGIPTPAIITRAALNLSNASFLTINAGLNVLPKIPYIDVGGKSGKDIRQKEAVKNPKEVYENAVILGKKLADICDFLVVGESIAGGTTTTLGVLTGLGYNAFGKVSSSMPSNPHDIKEKVVKEALKKIEKNADVFKVIEQIGDPMIPVHAGLCIGAAKHIPVFLAGGTQMAGILSVIKEIDVSVMDNLAITTTNWIIEDKTSDIIELINDIYPIPIIATNLSFKNTGHEGLKAYEKGIVKEGVGAGGATIMAYVKSKSEINTEIIITEVEEVYRGLLSQRNKKINVFN